MDEQQKSVEERLDRLERIVAGGHSQPYGHFEYKSSAAIFGWPLIHIATGIDPETGRLRIARGIIAIGNIAVGVLALGGVAFGLISLGGLSLAVLLALGGVALGGYVAAGGVAAASFLAAGGVAISWKYAIGGLAIGPHPLGGNHQDPAVLEFLRSLFPDWKV